MRRFWVDWAAGRISGRKITVTAWEGGGPLPCAVPRIAVGVVRLWESPYCGGKWFVEGLEVIESHRRCGIATKMLEVGTSRLREMGIARLFAHVRDSNVASISTVKRLGFAQVTEGNYVSSYGELITGGSEYLLDLTDEISRLTIK